MANQLYGYTPSAYGGGGGATTSIYSSRSGTGSYLSSDTSLLGSSSRYLSADSLSSSSALSSSLLYNPRATLLGFLAYPLPLQRTRTGRLEWMWVLRSSLPTRFTLGLKRTSSEYSLGTHNKIGQTEAWYSSNPLAKRPRYESTSHLPIYPQRPGEKDCAYYMQTRTCKFGDSCKFDHPIWVPEGGIPDWKEVPPVPAESLPERPGEPDCPYFLKTQRCKFGIRCKFNHPKDRIAPPGAPEDGDVFVLPERPSEPPCAFYMKTGKCKFGTTCKFHHPKGVQIQSTGEEIGNEVKNTGDEDRAAAFCPSIDAQLQRPSVRPGEEDCPFYLKTGSCKYGATCRYNHPDRYSAIASTLLTSPTTHFNLGVIAPTASLLSSFDPRLTQTTLGLGPTIYPQRPAPTASAAESLLQNVKLTLAGLPRREGAIHCPYYMKTGTCKIGSTCKFDHPPPGEVMAIASSQPGSSSVLGEGKENEDV
ncbi:UNVERIFIED_CONTAM: Zinc finger CCCH domain-containing protein 37 [Sesamum radiatum]|uniref:Zinc finger CCCH domain-containing protein 37 n=1 Tax=Sesamum radiatum TaxID=300843 RepID=A0AAW2KGV3_SESRA